jgi:hypothetical protein
MVERGSRRCLPTVGDGSPNPERAASGIRRAITLILGVAAIGASALGLYGMAMSAQASKMASPGANGAALTAQLARSHGAINAPPTTTTTTTTSPTALAPVSTSNAAAATPAPETSTAVVSALIREVETAGVDPGPHWSWAMGDTGACGAIAGGALATGCTSWSFGTEMTVFAGSPPLALVAHELANAEAASDAIPSLLAQVTAAEDGTSWSPIDAVASCLVEHFLGFQDNAAGSWQCPIELANQVAEDIHHTVVTNQTNARCGTTSGISSTLTFVGAAGPLTVTGPAPGSTPQTVGADTPVTVSGVGTFTAVDQGGTITVTGACTG